LPFAAAIALGHAVKTLEPVLSKGQMARHFGVSERTLEN
jgi:hypothetical protein